MKYNTNNFTYGFEIEGVFATKLWDKIEDLPLQSELKGDGSVHYGEIIHTNGLPIDTITSGHEVEINVGIFTNIATLGRTLRLFENGKNYWNDDSCGLHLHVKPKRAHKDAEEVFWSLKTIKALQTFAFKELCPCVAKRKNGYFCRNYSAKFINFFTDWQDREKYRFARRHPSGTIEFRFLAPCEHKADNVKKFLTYMTELLSKQKHSIKKVFTLELLDREQQRETTIAVNNNQERELTFNHLI